MHFLTETTPEIDGSTCLLSRYLVYLIYIIVYRTFDTKLKLGLFMSVYKVNTL